MRFANIGLFAALTALGFTGPTAADTILGDDQINITIAGNTLSDGPKWAEYYWANGTIARKSYRGEWSVKDGLVCFDYAGTKYDGCYQMAVEGDRVRLYSKEGEPQRDLSLIKGNPKNLTPAHAGELIDKSFYSGVAIKGYDPVAYFTEGRPVKGSAEFAQDWLGASWHFANATHKEAFVSNPEKYMPQFGGYCSKAMSDGNLKSLDPDAWRIIDGKLYVYSSKKGRDTFSKDIPGRTAKAEANWIKIKAGLAE